jgi:uncharacterized protein (TIGR02001 family)
MNALRLFLCTAAASAAFAGSALAQDDGPSIAFNIGANTDYVFRGVSQTNEGGSLFGGADLTIGKAYGGVWLSNVDFGNSTKAEYDIYAGFKPQAGPIALDLGVIYYGYTSKPAGPDEAYWEAKVAGSIPVGKATLGAAVYYSPEFFLESGEATYYEVNGSMPVNDNISVSGALGHQSVVGPADYTTWNLGVGYAFTPKFGLDLRYIDTSEHSFGKIYDGRVVLGVKATF